MRKILTLISLIFSVYLSGQVTCPPTPIKFQNTDLLQIWCKTSSVVAVTGTVPVFVVNQPTTTGTQTVTGNVGGYTKKNHYTVPTSTTAYAVGDCIGGDINIMNNCRYFNPTTSLFSNFVVYEVAFFDSTGHTPELDVTFLQYYYSANLDNAPSQFTGDQLRYLGNVKVLTTDWTVTGTTSRASIKYVGIICEGYEMTAVITTNTAITFPTKTCFAMKLGVIQD